MKGISFQIDTLNIIVPIRSGMYRKYTAKINVSAQELESIKIKFAKKHNTQVFPQTRFEKIMKWVAEELSLGTPVGAINTTIATKLERARKAGVENLLSRTTLTELMPTRFKGAGKGSRINDANLPDSLSEL